MFREKKKPACVFRLTDCDCAQCHSLRTAAKQTQDTRQGETDFLACTNLKATRIQTHTQPRSVSMLTLAPTILTRTK